MQICRRSSPPRLTPKVLRRATPACGINYWIRANARSAWLTCRPIEEWENQRNPRRKKANNGNHSKLSRPMKLSVIIPVFNEVDNIREILRRVQAVKLAGEIIV